MGAAATTDSSVVGKSGGALAVGSWVGAPFASTVVGPAFIFARVSCCSCTCCCSVFTVAVSASICWRKASTSLGEGVGDGCWARTAPCAQTKTAAISDFFKISSSLLFPALEPEGFSYSNGCVRRAFGPSIARNARSRGCRALSAADPIVRRARAARARGARRNARRRRKEQPAEEEQRAEGAHRAP